MRIRGVGRLKSIGRRLKNRFERGPFILLYHRIAEASSDPWSLAVTPGRFAQQLEVLCKLLRPMPLQRLSRALSDGDLSRRSVVITFDDGYADNLYAARPILERYDLPATVFVTTGLLEEKREFWWDELGKLLLQPGTLPRSLNLNINGSAHHWELGEAASYGEDISRRYNAWKAWEDAPCSRQSVYLSLWELLHPLMETERRKIFDGLFEWADAEPICRSTHRTLSPEEVAALAQGGLIEIGAHTVTHTTLAALTITAQRDEIQKSKARLEEVVNGPVVSFAYPYGSRSDYTSDTVDLVRQAGFSLACSNFFGVVKRSTDRFQLPRIQVHNWDGEEFSRQIIRRFHG